MDHKFHYGIDFVVSRDLPDAKHYRAIRGSYNIDCPFCNRKAKMNINLAKDVYHCPACDEGGGLLALHQKLKGFRSKKEALQDLEKIWLEADEPTRSKILKDMCRIPDLPESLAASIEVRDAVYTAFLNMLCLSKPHHDDLVRRGLSEDEIIRNQYKSVPCVGFQTLAENAMIEARAEGNREFLMSSFKRLGSDIPGFYWDDGIRCVRRRSGYFVPVRDMQGRISGLQIRYDALPEEASEEERERYHKYAWFSSSEKETGCAISGIETIHHAGFVCMDDSTPDSANRTAPRTVCLTEGALKADIAHALSGKPFIALIGIANHSQLSDELVRLRDRGVEEIHICTDMDYVSNPNVRTAMEAIERIIEEVGLKQKRFVWDKAYKGIDDFLLGRRQWKDHSK